MDAFLFGGGDIDFAFRFERVGGGDGEGVLCLALFGAGVDFFAFGGDFVRLPLFTGGGEGDFTLLPRFTGGGDGSFTGEGDLSRCFFLISVFF